MNLTSFTVSPISPAAEVLRHMNSLLIKSIGRPLKTKQAILFAVIWEQNDITYPKLAKKVNLSVSATKKAVKTMSELLKKGLDLPENTQITKTNLKSIIETFFYNSKITKYQFEQTNLENKYNTNITQVSTTLSPILKNASDPFDHEFYINYLKDKQIFSNCNFYIIRNMKKLIEEKIAIVKNASEKLLFTGSRSRNSKYLKIIEDKLSSNQNLIYYRVLINSPHHLIFKEHLLKVLSTKDIFNKNYNHQTIHIGFFTDNFYESEKFICANEKKVLIVLPSVNGVGLYDTALISTDKEFVKNMIRYVQELYSASEPYETTEKIKNLEIIRTPEIPARGW